MTNKRPRQPTPTPTSTPTSPPTSSPASTSTPTSTSASTPTSTSTPKTKTELHQDRFRVGFSGISKSDWDRIFGDSKDSTEKLAKRAGQDREKDAAVIETQGA